MATSVTLMRQAIGLKTPNWDQKQLIWSRVKSPTAKIEDGYTPGKTAKRAHMSDGRAIAVSGGSGAGKSLFSGMEGVTWLPYADLIWIVAYGYRKARAEFQYLSEAAISTGLALQGDVRLPNDEDKPCSMQSIEFPDGHRCLVQTITVRDYQEQLTTRRPDIIILCEPGLIDDLADMEPTIWGRLAERRGRLIAAGTSEEMSEDWFHILEEWAKPENETGGEVYTLPTWENLRMYPLGEKEPVFVTYRKRFGDDMYQMRFGGRPAVPKGLVLKGYWGEHLIDDDLEFNPGLPLEVFIDPNYSDPNRYSIGFVQYDDHSDDVDIVDEIAKEGCTHPEMIELFRAHPLSRHVFGGVIDPHSGDHHAGGSESPMEYWRDVIPDLFCGTRQIPLRNTVQAIKEMMTPRSRGRRPRLRIARRCERMIQEGSRWKLSPQGKPKPTWCDMLKGFGYWSVRKLGDERVRESAPDNIVRAQDYDLGHYAGRRAQSTAPYADEYERIYGEPLGV